MKRVREFVSPSGARKVLLFRRDDGLFQIQEIYLDDDGDGGVCWLPGWQSGIFDDQQQAEMEMLAVTLWLGAA